TGQATRNVQALPKAPVPSSQMAGLSGTPRRAHAETSDTAQRWPTAMEQSGTAQEAKRLGSVLISNATRTGEHAAADPGTGTRAAAERRKVRQQEAPLQLREQPTGRRRGRPPPFRGRRRHACNSTGLGAYEIDADNRRQAGRR